MDWDHFSQRVQECFEKKDSKSHLEAYTYVYFIFTDVHLDQYKFLLETANWICKNYQSHDQWTQSVKIIFSLIENYSNLFRILSQSPELVNLLKNPSNLWKLSRIFPKRFDFPFLGLVNPDKLFLYLSIGLNLDFPCIEAISRAYPNLLLI